MAKTNKYIKLTNSSFTIEITPHSDQTTVNAIDKAIQALLEVRKKNEN